MGEMQAGNTGKVLKYAKYLTVIPALTMHYKNDVQIQIIVSVCYKKACLPRENLAFNMSKQKVQNNHKITRITKLIYV